ncbi:hypothetical protein Droror1_Dr00023994 [Drosera rotundifolia]
MATASRIVLVDDSTQLQVTHYTRSSTGVDPTTLFDFNSSSFFSFLFFFATAPSSNKHPTIPYLVNGTPLIHQDHDSNHHSTTSDSVQPPANTDDETSPILDFDEMGLELGQVKQIAVMNLLKNCAVGE